MKAIVIPSEKMAKYIKFCQEKDGETCMCPCCGKTVSGYKTFPYFYDAEENDVYFAELCPKCGELMISKE